MTAAKCGVRLSYSKKCRKILYTLTFNTKVKTNLCSNITKAKTASVRVHVLTHGVDCGVEWHWFSEWVHVGRSQNAGCGYRSVHSIDLTAVCRCGARVGRCCSAALAHIPAASSYAQLVRRRYIETFARVSIARYMSCCSKVLGEWHEWFCDGVCKAASRGSCGVYGHYSWRNINH